MPLATLRQGHPRVTAESKFRIYCVRQPLISTPADNRLSCLPMRPSELKPLHINLEGQTASPDSETRQVILRLSSTIRQHEYLRQPIAKCVPPALMNQIIFARSERQVLRLTVNNSAAASRLRFLTRELIDAVTPVTGPIRKVSLHVLPAEAVQTRQTRRVRPKVSPATANRVRQVANSLPRVDTGRSAADSGGSEDKLAAALNRLADNLSR